MGKMIPELVFWPQNRKKGLGKEIYWWSYMFICKGDLISMDTASPILCLTTFIKGHEIYSIWHFDTKYWVCSLSFSGVLKTFSALLFYTIWMKNSVGLTEKSDTHAFENYWHTHSTIYSRQCFFFSLFDPTVLCVCTWTCVFTVPFQGLFQRFSSSQTTGILSAFFWILLCDFSLCLLLAKILPESPVTPGGGPIVLS